MKRFDDELYQNLGKQEVRKRYANITYLYPEILSDFASISEFHCQILSILRIYDLSKIVQDFSPKIVIKVMLCTINNLASSDVMNFTLLCFLIWVSLLSSSATGLPYDLGEGISSVLFTHHSS